MKKMFLLFSHSLTIGQKSDAKHSLRVDEFVEFPQELQTLWSDIPSDIKTLSGYFTPLKNYLISCAKKGDYILIQGDFGGVHKMVNFSKKIGIIPVYSTTKRVTHEITIDNEVKKISTFKHVIYRRY